MRGSKTSQSSQQKHGSIQEGALSCLMDVLRQSHHHEVKDLWTFSSLEALVSAVCDKVTPFDRKNANSFNYKCLECHSLLHHHKSPHAKSQIISHSPTSQEQKKKNNEHQYFEQIRVIFQIENTPDGGSKEKPQRYLTKVLQCRKCTSYFGRKDLDSLARHVVTCWRQSDTSQKR